MLCFCWIGVFSAGTFSVCVAGFFRGNRERKKLHRHVGLNLCSFVMLLIFDLMFFSFEFRYSLESESPFVGGLCSI